MAAVSHSARVPSLLFLMQPTHHHAALPIFELPPWVTLRLFKFNLLGGSPRTPTRAAVLVACAQKAPLCPQPQPLLCGCPLGVSRVRLLGPVVSPRLPRLPRSPPPPAGSVSSDPPLVLFPQSAGTDVSERCYLARPALLGWRGPFPRVSLTFAVPFGRRRPEH